MLYYAIVWLTIFPILAFQVQTLSFVSLNQSPHANLNRIKNCNFDQFVILTDICIKMWVESSA